MPKAAIKLVKNNDWTISQQELDRLIKEHNGTMNNVLMTPAMASYILKNYNNGNRRLRVGHANFFAQTLSRGGWENTGEAVIFAKEGVLNNGQHRLEGIVRSGISALMDIRFGIPREAFSVTDTGAKRLAGDVLSISGSTSPFASAAAVKLLLAYEAGLPTSYVGSMKIGNDQILAGFRRWPEIEQAVNMNHQWLKRKGFITAASNAFTLMALKQTDDETVSQFLELVESGLTKSKNDSPRLLREKILDDITSSRGNRSHVVERFALFIKAWNFWREGERPARLIWRSDEVFPKMKVKL